MFFLCLSLFLIIKQKIYLFIRRKTEDNNCHVKDMNTIREHGDSHTDDSHKRMK